MNQVLVNGKDYTLTGSPSVREFLADIGFGKRRVIVERNNVPLPVDKLESTEIEDGDRLEVIQLVGGG